MDVITGYLSAHPAVFVLIVILAIILILHVIFKNLIKLVLIMLIVLLTAFGYYYFKDPKTIEKSFDTMKSGINEIVDTSKSFRKDTKELYKKGKEVPGDINKLLKDSNKDLDKELKK